VVVYVATKGKGATRVAAVDAAPTHAGKPSAAPAGHGRAGAAAQRQGDAASAGATHTAVGSDKAGKSGKTVAGSKSDKAVVARKSVHVAHN